MLICKRLFVSSFIIWLLATNGLANAKEKFSQILIFGDSLVQGYGLSKSENFVSQMEAVLTKDTQISLINGGVSGDTTAGGLSRLEWSLTPEISAVMVVLGGNDMLRGIDPHVSMNNLRGILKILEDKRKPVLLAGMQSAKNFGTQYKRSFDQIYIDLAQEFDLIFYPYFLSSLFDKTEKKIQLEYLQKDGIHPNPEGVRLIVRDLTPSFYELIDKIELIK